MLQMSGTITTGRLPNAKPKMAKSSNHPSQFMAALMNTLDPGQPSNLLSLTVRGDSMIDANVNDGDTIILDPSQDVRNGEMIAVWLADENTTALKYFHRDDFGITLQPANPAHHPIKIERPEQVHIQGKVVAVIRKMARL